MTTSSDLGTEPQPAMLRCELRASNLYPTLVLALRDLRSANGRDETTGDGDGNASWTALTVGMIVLDTLSGDSRRDVSKRWTRLLTSHDIVGPDASLIYALRCSLLHGYGLPKPADIDDRRLLLTDDTTGYALDTERPGIATLSVPVFCSHLVERLANQAETSWDTSLIDTNLQL
ncbi:MAG TPA: hypothetical protein VJ914_27385 [Pseudonocardiaceae bacterium]|nr:hypothetical protein [Pseudonocardiaceae bacterium]